MEHISPFFLICKSVGVLVISWLNVSPSLGTEIVRAGKSKLQSPQFSCIFLMFFLFYTYQDLWALFLSHSLSSRGFYFAPKFLLFWTELVLRTQT